MTTGIYGLWFGGSTTPYIGQSIYIEGRYASHLRLLDSGRGINKVVQRMYNTCGPPTLAILEEVEVSQLFEREVWWYRKYVREHGVLNQVDPVPVVDVKKKRQNTVPDLFIIDTLDLSLREAARIVGLDFRTIAFRRRILKGLCKWCGKNPLTDHAGLCNDCFDRSYR